MRKSITNVKKNARNLSNQLKEKTVDWRSVLADIRADIERLTTFARIVEGKIERGEPWPGVTPQSSDQKTESCHSV
jgi:hypothetical protein